MEKYWPIVVVICVILIILFMVFTSKKRILRIYNKYMKISNSCNLTGKEFAFLSKTNLKLSNIQFAVTDSKLADAYSSKLKVLILSKEVCNTASLSSLAIVSHELGHAIQDNTAYPPLRLWQVFLKITNITNILIIPLCSIGLLLYFTGILVTIGWQIFIISFILFLIHIFCRIIEIPVEYNASKTALNYLLEFKLITPSEKHKIKKLLNTAALTYVAGFFDDIFTFAKRK